MKRMCAALSACLAMLVLATCVRNPEPDIGAESLVESSRWTIETFKRNPEQPIQVFREQMKDAKGVVVFPNVLKGAFVLGAEGGSGVLLMRKEDGTWGYPAFYTLGGGSLGLQAGARASEMVLVLRTDRAVEAIVRDQGKLGGDMEITVGPIGAGLSASTTTNLGADVVGFSQGAGLYGGLSLEGAALVRRGDYNEAYYGAGATPEGIVFDGMYANPHADALRKALVF